MGENRFVVQPNRVTNRNKNSLALLLEFFVPHFFVSSAFQTANKKMWDKKIWQSEIAIIKFLVPTHLSTTSGQDQLVVPSVPIRPFALSDDGPVRTANEHFSRVIPIGPSVAIELKLVHPTQASTDATRSIGGN